MASPCSASGFDNDDDDNVLMVEVACLTAVTWPHADHVVSGEMVVVLGAYARDAMRAHLCMELRDDHYFDVDPELTDEAIGWAWVEAHTLVLPASDVAAFGRAMACHPKCVVHPTGLDFTHLGDEVEAPALNGATATLRHVFRLPAAGVAGLAVNIQHHLGDDYPVATVTAEQTFAVPAADAAVLMRVLDANPTPDASLVMAYHQLENLMFRPARP